MPTDWPAHPCTLRYIGPGIPCVANRFYPKTVCHPPPFFYFDWADTQTEGNWLWLNNNHWLEWNTNFTDDPRWIHERYLTTLNTTLSLRYFDNPDFPSISPFPFIARFDVGARRSLITPWTIFRYETIFGYSTTTLERPASWLVTQSSWVRLIPNDPTIGRPIGLVTFDPRLCQPDWSQTQAPR